jgi:hypothetical protein
MGLLNKAMVKALPELDDMEKALRDRILQLSDKASSPYTSLSLLRAYGFFQFGVCLSLEQGNYVAYASAGFGIETIVIPQDLLPAPLVQVDEDPRRRYYKFERADALPLKPVPPSAILWFFPLHDMKPCIYVMLLVEEGVSRFNPKMMARLLLDIKNTLIPRTTDKELKVEPIKLERPPIKRFNTALFDALTEAPGGKLPPAQPALIPATPPVVPPAPDQAAQPLADPALRGVIAEYHRTNPVFQGLVLETPSQASVTLAVSSIGRVIPLSPERSLVLLPKTLDRELIAHRLSKSIGLTILSGFEVESPEGALALTAPYLPCPRTS